MSKLVSANLFYLIKSMKKAEKRYFKVFIGREGNSSDMKIVKLFDAIDKQKEYDEKRILKEVKEIKSSQLPNLKSHLYQRILRSMRLFNAQLYDTLNLREQIDYVEVLYNRSLYFQCQKLLIRAKKLAYKSDNLELLLEILKWEKRILSHTSGRANQEKANEIVEEVELINRRISNINTFTNLSAQLNAIYMKTGFIRNKQDYDTVKQIIKSSLPEYNEDDLSFSEKIYLYDLMVLYYYYLQDFESVYIYARKWVKLFDEDTNTIPIQLEMYVKGLNSLLIAQNRLMKYHEFVATKNRLRHIRQMPVVRMNQNISQKVLKYIYVHEFNGFFMLGDFDTGVKLINRIKPGLEDFINSLDEHSKLILYYKLACLYFGNEEYRESIKWLNIIINEAEYDLREDVLCFARILNLISHYELGNDDVIDYYLRSTYRFLYKKEDLHFYQKFILNFLKNLNRNITEEELIGRFKELRTQLLKLVENPYDSRAFIYFDIISWLDSKIEKRPVMDVIKEKARMVIDKEAA